MAYYAYYTPNPDYFFNKQISKTLNPRLTKIFNNLADLQHLITALNNEANDTMVVDF